LFDQNEFFNANRWDYNRSGIPRQRLRDNRFGGAAGGPLRRNKTFFFANYEGRASAQTAPVHAYGSIRFAPTGYFEIRRRQRNGSQLHDAELRSARHRLSPVVQNFWNRLPKGNDPTLGDGLNTIGFRGPGDASLNMDFGVFRPGSQF